MRKSYSIAFSIVLLLVLSKVPCAWSKQRPHHQVHFVSSRSINLTGPNLLAGCSVRGRTVFLAGTTSNQPGTNRPNLPWIASLSTDGNVNWLKNIFSDGSTDELHALLVDAQDDLYVVGGTSSDRFSKNKGERDAFIAKFSSAGNPLWLKKFGTSQDDVANGVCFTPQGYLCVVGFTQGSLFHRIRGVQEMFLILLRPDGSLILGKQTGDQDYTTAEKVTCDAKGNIFICGETFHWFGPSRGDGDIFAAQFTPYGEVNWGCQFGTPYADYATGIGIDASSNVYVCGRLHDELPHKSSGIVAKVDRTGHRLWTNNWVTQGETQADSLFIHGGRIFCCGNTSAPLFGPMIGTEKGVVAVYDVNGNLTASGQLGVGNAIETAQIIGAYEGSSTQGIVMGLSQKSHEPYHIMWHIFSLKK